MPSLPRTTAVYATRALPCHPQKSNRMKRRKTVPLPNYAALGDERSSGGIAVSRGDNSLDFLSLPDGPAQVRCGCDK